MTSGHHWRDMGRTEIKELGRAIVEQRLTQLGCAVARDGDARSGRMLVRARNSRAELYVSTQRVGGYAFWTKRRLEPAVDRYAVLVLLSEGEPPALYCIPTLDWLTPSHPLTDRDYVGQASEPDGASKSTAQRLAPSAATPGRRRPTNCFLADAVRVRACVGVSHL